MGHPAHIDVALCEFSSPWKNSSCSAQKHLPSPNWHLDDHMVPPWFSSAVSLYQLADASSVRLDQAEASDLSQKRRQADFAQQMMKMGFMVPLLKAWAKTCRHFYHSPLLGGYPTIVAAGSEAQLRTTNDAKERTWYEPTARVRIRPEGSGGLLGQRFWSEVAAQICGSSCLCIAFFGC